MNKEYERMTKILAKEFGKNRKMYLATSYDKRPYVRIINTFYWDKSFYFVTLKSSELMQMILKNKMVSLCSSASFHKFRGEAIDLGHPLLEENREVRNELTKVMADWYVEHHDESDDQLRIVRVKIDKAFTYANRTGYDIDFTTSELNSFDYAPFA